MRYFDEAMIAFKTSKPTNTNPRVGFHDTYRVTFIFAFEKSYFDSFG